jgi:hypothetical protein
MNAVTVHPLTGLKQPSTKPLIGSVRRVAGRRLLCLHQNPVAAISNEILDFSVFLGRQHQLRTRHAKEMASELHHTLRAEIALIRFKECADRRLTTDTAYLDGNTIGSIEHD